MIPEPRSYQLEGARFCVTHGAAGLFFSPGLGKTRTMLMVFQALRRVNLVHRMLVIAPLKAARRTWPAEVVKWGYGDIMSTALVHGTHMKMHRQLASNADITLINPEGLRWLVDKDISGIDMLVVDESTKFKHPDTQRFRLLKRLLPKFRRRYILTGSPAPNGLMDLFGQIYVLDQGETWPYITQFRLEYFDQIKLQPRRDLEMEALLDADGYLPDGSKPSLKKDAPEISKWELKTGADQRIYNAIKHIVIRKDAADELDLPPLVHIPHVIDMTDAATAHYRKLEKTLVLEMEQGVVSAANAASATGKLRQVANGGIYLDDRTEAEYATVHDAKIEALKDLVEELQGDPALVAYEFRHDRDRLLAAFPGTPWVGGGLSPAQIDQRLDAWNAGKLPLLFVQSASVAHGLNLQEGRGHTLVWFGLTWDLEVTEQLIDRLHRQGQKNRVIVHWLMMAGTIDETVYRSLSAKDKTQRALLAALKSDIQSHTTPELEKVLSA
ncbi:MAG TPA: DEAD/DEAH box helicase [Candidatus Binataceae bacterium]|nr:DEAD/DEAH box helicase [Candidatus Binataceae bacterium]